jgi:DNA-binding SARP family transcriptional activator/TolB-like protein
MLEVQTLGAAYLRSHDGHALHSVLAQPKRLALLIYLAHADPRGFQRRDTLLAMFWPETDDERARNSLRQALHFLRRSMGEGVILSRGDGEIGIAEGTVRCDAADFERALEERRAEEALELYRGNFLQGFFIADAPEFERWVGSERMRLRERAGQAAWALAERAEQARDAARSLEWARRAMHLSPDDEHSLQRVISLLDRLGDRVAAIRAYEEFAAKLKEEYQIVPSPETQELIRGVRGRTGIGNAMVTPASSGHVPPEDIQKAPVAARFARFPLHGAEPVRSVAARRSRPPNRVAVIGLVMLVLAASAGYIVWQQGTSDASSAVAAPTSLAVLPFTVRSSPELAFIGEAVVSLLGTKFDGAAGLRSVGARGVIGMAAQEPTGASNVETAGAIARRLGAGLFVIGEILEMGGRVHIEAALYKTSSPSIPYASATVEGKSTDLFQLVDRLAAQLLIGVIGSRADRSARIAALTTTSLPALRAYLEGEREQLAGRFDLAASAFQRAVAEDSTFALAYYKLSLTREWAPGHRDLLRPLEHAMRHIDRLSEHDQALIAASYSWRKGESEMAAQQYRAILERYPDDVEAWFQLGEILFHDGPLRGRSISNSRIAWERVLAFEPTNPFSIVHLARIAAVERDTVLLADLARRLGTDSLADWRFRHVEALRALAVGDAVALERVTREQRRLGAANLSQVTEYVTAFTREPAAAAGLLRGIADAEITGARTAEMLAYLEAARGRYSAAENEILSVERTTPAGAAFIRALLATIPFRDAPAPGTLARIRNDLESHPAATDLWGEVAEVHSPQIRLYLLGLLAAAAGERTRAGAYARDLEGVARGSGTDAAVAGDFARGIRARLLMAEGRAMDALRLLEKIEPRLSYSHMELPVLDQVHERYLRAEALLELGRDAEALSWYRSISEFSPYGIVYLANSHLRRGEIHERRGELKLAGEHYRRFEELWQDADAKLRPDNRSDSRR